MCTIQNMGVCVGNMPKIDPFVIFVCVEGAQPNPFGNMARFTGTRHSHVLGICSPINSTFK
jgi:hypothetical protein